VTVRAVVLPATPLLVPGAAGAADVLAELRAVVLDELGRALHAAPATGARWAVLADGPSTRRGARRASLAAAGIADRWVPALPDAPDGATSAAVPASVALWAAAAAGAPGHGPVEVVELADAASQGDVAGAVEALADVDVVVVAGAGQDGPGAGTARALDVLAGREGWVPRAVTVTVDGPHLLAGYAVTVWEADRAADQGAAAG
jgi:hypothetical protein